MRQVHTAKPPVSHLDHIMRHLCFRLGDNLSDILSNRDNNRDIQEDRIFVWGKSDAYLSACVSNSFYIKALEMQIDALEAETVPAFVIRPVGVLYLVYDIFFFMYK